jgi:hypothetical protein
VYRDKKRLAARKPGLQCSPELQPFYWNDPTIPIRRNTTLKPGLGGAAFSHMQHLNPRGEPATRPHRVCNGCGCIQKQIHWRLAIMQRSKPAPDVSSISSSQSESHPDSAG